MGWEEAFAARVGGHRDQVRKTPSWPRSWANRSLFWLYSRRRMHGPACIFWANLTPVCCRSSVSSGRPR
jgi:hypothetical protein